MSRGNMASEKIIHHSKEDSHEVNHTAKLNWLRAAVLGADDGIVSVAGLVVGVAGATSHQGVIVAAGLAGIIAGAGESHDAGTRGGDSRLAG